jgi:hypothetical protein
MSAPTTYDEVKTTWSNQVFTELMTNFDPTGWADITLPVDGKECNTVMFKANIFYVDVDALVTLCATVDDCTFVSADYSSFAFGFVFDRGTGLDGGACTIGHPHLYTKDDSVLPFDGISWGLPFR